MPKIVSLKRERRGLWLEQQWLEEAALPGDLEAVILSNVILIKPRSLTQRMRGIVSPQLSLEELDNLYKERTL